MALHALPQVSIQQQADRIVLDESFEGVWLDGISDTLSTRIGNSASGQQSITGIPIPDAEGYVVTGARFQRKEGARCEAHFTYSIILKREIWNIEWQEISKDVRTWIASDNCPNRVTGVEAAKQLAALAAWEQLRDKGDWTHYENFEYPYSTGDNMEAAWTGLPSPVKVVAEKILKGVQSYSIFAPVVTRTTTHPFMPPASGKLGKIDTPTSYGAGWSSFNGATLDFTTLATAWLKNVERSSSNSDGTFTLSEGWLGADEIDGDLYKTAAGGNE